MFSEKRVVSIENEAIRRLKSFREERNISQLELSLQSGVSQNMITYIETGKRTPTLRTIIKLCDALQVSPAKLFEEDNIEKENAKQSIIEMVKKYM